MKKAEQQNETASVIACNDAEADYHKSEAQVNRTLNQLRNIDLAREKKKDEFDESQDYRNGHITFAATIDDETSLQLNATLRRLARMYPKQPITIELNSPGGSIIHTFAIIDQIAELQASGIKVTMAVRGHAASGAGVMLQAASKRIIGPNSFVMLHRASFQTAGSADQVEDTVNEVKKYEAQMYKIIAKRSGKTQEWWKKKLGERKDVWWDADEALKDGLVDAIG